MPKTIHNVGGFPKAIHFSDYRPPPSPPPAPEMLGRAVFYEKLSRSAFRYPVVGSYFLVWYEMI